eukprot:scaffold8303_cov30-Tisochrysis_lutea.AAC.3
MALARARGVCARRDTCLAPSKHDHVQPPRMLGGSERHELRARVRAPIDTGASPVRTATAGRRSPPSLRRSRSRSLRRTNI